MIFSSIPFLYYYLPIVLVCYLLVPMKFKNGVLFLASLFFYAWGEPRYVVLMLISIALGYFYGYMIGKSKERRQAKVWLGLSCVTSLSLLGYFKYADSKCQCRNWSFHFDSKSGSSNWNQLLHLSDIKLYHWCLQRHRRASAKFSKVCNLCILFSAAHSRPDCKISGYRRTAW